jgi:nucleotide-binding universal stress UspA family protein
LTDGRGLVIGMESEVFRVVVVVWIAEGVWHAAVDGADAIAPPDAQIVLVHVIPDMVDEVVHGAFAGLLGRHRSVPAVIDDTEIAAQHDLLRSAGDRLGRPARWEGRRGRVEREVVAACAGADLLVLSRDGDRSRLGPHSLGPASRFVVDHAPCAVLLTWPGSVPTLSTIPPPPDHSPPGPPTQPPIPPSPARP